MTIVNYDTPSFLLYSYIAKTKYGSPNKTWGQIILAYVLSHTDCTDSTDFQDLWSLLLGDETRSTLVLKEHE